jgi:hypothetical protein
MSRKTGQQPERIKAWLYDINQSAGHPKYQGANKKQSALNQLATPSDWRKNFTSFYHVYPNPLVRFPNNPEKWTVEEFVDADTVVFRWHPEVRYNVILY